MTRPIRVLHVVASMNRGGIETYLMNMLRHYDRARFVMDFCYLYPEPGDYAEEIKQLGSKLIPCRMRYDLVRFTPRMVRLLRRGKYDVVDAHPGDFAGPSLLAAAWAKVPVRVASYHNVQPHYRTDGIRGLYAKLMHGMVNRYATVATGCSKAALDAYFPGWPDRRDKIFQVRYYGIDYDKFAGANSRQRIKAEFNIPADCAIVGHVGRICQPKNHRTLVDTAELLLKKCPNARFLVVGDGPMKTDIEQYVASKTLQPSFIFTGRRTDIPELMSAMDVFFFPSIDEGFGLVLLEAQAAGAAIVASNIVAITEATCPVYQECLSNPTDAITFAGNLEKMLKDSPHKRQALAKAKDFVRDNFSIAAAVARFENLYKQAYDLTGD